MAYSNAFLKPAFRLLALAVCLGVFSAAVDARAAGTYYVKKKETISSETGEASSPYIRKSRKERELEKEQAGQEEAAGKKDSEDKIRADNENMAPAAPQVYAQNCSRDDEKALREIEKKLENMEKGSGDKSDLGFFESDKNIAIMTDLFQRCGAVAAKIMDN